MSAIAALGRSIRTAASVAVSRIRRHVASILGRGTADTRGDGGEEVAVPAGPLGDEGTFPARQSTRRSSPGTPGNWSRSGNADGGPGHGEGSLADAGRPGTGKSVRPDPAPIDGLDERDRPLGRPADDEPNGTMTEGRRRPDGRVRIEDPGSGEAYLESDVSVSLDHFR